MILENFPHLKTDLHLQIKEVAEFKLRSVGKDTPKHIWGKFLLRKILKASGWKEQVSWWKKERRTMRRDKGVGERETRYWEESGGRKCGNRQGGNQMTISKSYLFRAFYSKEVVTITCVWVKRQASLQWKKGNSGCALTERLWTWRLPAA